MTVDDYIDKDLTHSVHTSESRSFRGCRRRWNWIFREFWYPTTTPQPLEFGVAYHAALETWYNPDRWYSDREVQLALAKSTFIDKTREQKTQYLKLNEGNIDPEKEAEYDSNVKLGLSMLEYYCTEISPEYDRFFRPVKVEISFEIPIVNPDTKEQLWCKCNTCWDRYQAWLRTQGVTLSRIEGVTDWWTTHYAQWQGLPVTYGGRIDCLMEDLNTNRYWCVDWKTAARLSGIDVDDSYLLNDDQITRYCYALWTLGIDVVGFIYAEQKKTIPEEPEALQRPYKGRWFSTNKQKGYTYEVYKKTVEENDPLGYDAGVYNEFLEYLRDNPTRFVLRHQVHRNEVELRSAGRNLYLEAADMVDPNLRLYPSAGRFACSTCAFRQPCLMVNSGDDYLYTLQSSFEKRRYHYWQEREMSTDTKGGQ